VSSQDLRFGLASESQTFTITANCKWSIIKNDDADWYTISPMSGKAKDSIVTVTVNDYSHGDFRGSSLSSIHQAAISAARFLSAKTNSISMV
jgi:hypothetical protein